MSAFTFTADIHGAIACFRSWVLVESFSAAINAAGRFIMCLEPEGQSFAENIHFITEERKELRNGDSEGLDGRVWGHWSVDAL